ncbi:MAG: hypothetical protein V4582_18885 [Pseudomonadota bacterium]
MMPTKPGQSRQGANPNPQSVNEIERALAAEKGDATTKASKAKRAKAGGAKAGGKGKQKRGH